jgi:hypothetical protein
MTSQPRDVALAQSDLAAFRVRLEAAESLADRARILQELGARLAHSHGQVIPASGTEGE